MLERTFHIPVHNAESIAPHEVVPAKTIKKALGVDNRAMMDHKLTRIANLLYLQNVDSEEQVRAHLARAIELYESLAPTDGAEGMLAEQMVATHFAALECLRRAAIPNQSVAGIEVCLKNAHKLMALYVKQVAALDKHRGKGQQKVTVEHVNVASGGQAIVGNVERGITDKPDNREVAALGHKGEVPFDMGKEQTPAPRRKKKRK